MSRIPLVDLAWQHREIRAEIEPAFASVMERGAFILGPEVAAFEEAFAAASGTAHCIGVANGTDALELALRALDIGPGDEVVVPANSFVASALAVVRAGAQPVFCDSDADSHLMDPEAARAVVGERTRALMPVNLFGQIAPMEAVAALAAERGLAIVEDAAQSQGASREGRRSGSFGVLAATSFYPAKNLGAYGDAGAVTTDDAELAARVRRLRGYGSERKYHHSELGFNSRLDTLQAVVLSAKLLRLDAWNADRRRAAARYDELLRSLAGVSLPRTLAGNEHVFHVYAVRVEQRERVLAALHEEGVEAGVHYPVPIHLQPAFAMLGHAEGDFPRAEAAAREMLSLPLYPGISDEQQERVASSLSRALAKALCS